MLKFKKTKYISLDNYMENKPEDDQKEDKSIGYESNLMDIRNSDNFAFDSSFNDSLLANKMQEQEESSDKAPFVPDGAWIKCSACGETLYNEDVSFNEHCCPKCGEHFRIGSGKRLNLIIDEGSFTEWSKHKTTKNVLNFPDYDEKIKGLQIKTGLLESVITGEGEINGKKTAIAIMDNSFLMGSMGQIVGEKITRAIEKATRLKLPIIIVSTSGGARMQEGIVSLMQMAKTSAALKRHSDAGLLYVSILTDPTTGGVTASFAMLGDVIIAEPGALIGFAGPRVIEQTIGQKLPEGFQRAEFLLEKGFVDMIVERSDMKKVLEKLLCFHS